jgi:hypothetical protein
MFYSVTASGGKRFIINLNLVQRIEIFDRSLCLFYNTPHVSGLLSNKMHYKLIYFCPKTDLVKVYEDILSGLSKKGLLIETGAELK